MYFNCSVGSDILPRKQGKQRKLQRIDEIEALGKTSKERNLSPLRVLNLDEFDKFDKKRKPKEQMFRSLKYEMNSLYKPILYDNFWCGVFALASSKEGESRFYPMTEFFFKYSEALQFSLCLNIIDKEYLNMKKLGYGLKFLFFAIGYGDGFFRCFLDNETLKKTWEVFQINSLAFNDFQFMPTGFCSGFAFSFLKHFFVSLFYRNDAKHSIGLCGFIRYNYFFLAVYFTFINLYFKINSSFFNEAFFFSLSYEKICISLVGINIVQILFALMYLKNLSDFVNQFFSLYLMIENLKFLLPFVLK